MELRVITCQPGKSPEELMISKSIEATITFINGWFEVIGLGYGILLYCHEHPTDHAFNRMIQDRPIFGNFIISKLGMDENNKSTRIDLSDQDINFIMTDLLKGVNNETN